MPVMMGNQDYFNAAQDWKNFNWPTNAPSGWPSGAQWPANPYEGASFGWGGADFTNLPYPTGTNIPLATSGTMTPQQYLGLWGMGGESGNAGATGTTGNAGATGTGSQYPGMGGVLPPELMGAYSGVAGYLNQLAGGIKRANEQLL